MTVLTCDQLGARFEGIARTIAAILVAVYVFGEMLGKAIYGLSDWLAEFTRQPLQTIIDAIPTVEPQPALLAVLEAQILEPEALELEIQSYDAQTKPLARRKPAKARKAAVAA